MNEVNERKGRHFFSSADMNAEVWDQASRPVVKTMCFQAENQFFNLAFSQQEVLPPALVSPADQGIREL